MNRKHYLSAQEAADALNISLSTLYSYVSRGLIRSEEADSSKRTRRYSRDDVEHLKQRKEHRRDPIKAVDGALDWGMPLLESSITLIQDGHLYYRGHDVLDLAQNHHLEAVAALIWTGDLNQTSIFHKEVPPSPAELKMSGVNWADLSLMEQFQGLLPVLAAQDYAAYDTRPEAVARTGVRITQALSVIASGRRLEPHIAGRLAAGWAPQETEGQRLIDAALILCADHELNVSSFTGRCIASAGSTPYSVVAGGLAALQGKKHGGFTRQVDAFLHEISTAGDSKQAIAGRLKRGENIPGFGHRLYPEGDPRARLLLELLRESYSHTEETAFIWAVQEAVFELISEHPTIDFGLVALARTLNLPLGSPLALFAIGRTVGWIGHAIEEYEADRIIRPRARYTGSMPENDLE
jgi:citrate synthase